MRSYLKHIFPATLLLLLGGFSSCSEELLSLGQTGEIEDGKDITISFPLDIPELNASTRSLGETLESPKDASIYLFAFNEDHIITNIFTGEYNSTGKDEDGTSHNYYNVTIKSSKEPRYYHLLVNHNKLDINSIGYVTGSELFNSDAMIVDNNQDVYWQRVYLKEVTEASAKAAFEHLKMVRNFCKITLKIEDNEGSGTLEDAQWGLGFIPTKSYVAPYIGEQNFATYLKSDGSIATYDELEKEGYRGHVPRKVEDNDFYSVTKDFDTNGVIDWKSTDDPLYCYENEGSNKSSLYEKTMIFLRGKYKAKDAENAENKYTYYRISLVDPDNNYNQLDMLRNIEYDVTITAVNAEGYATAEDASNRPANNNLSGSTVTNMYPVVTDETAALRVGYVKKYIVSPASFDLTYRYVPDSEKTNDDGSYMSSNGNVTITTTDGVQLNAKSTSTTNDGATVTVENAVTGEDVDISGTSVGNVLSAINVAQDDDAKSNYRTVTFTPNSGKIQTGGLSESATVRVSVPGTVLYRDVELILRERYKMQNLELVRDNSYTAHGSSSEGSKDCYTLTVDVPNNMPDEMFSLDFTFETIPAIVYPNVEKSIMEVNGTHASIFDSSQLNIFHYHRAVTTTTYNTKYTGSAHGYGGFVDDGTYKKISFFFKLNTTMFESILTQNKENNRDYVIIRLGVYNDIFSPNPDDDVTAKTPKILDAYYKFTEDGDGYYTATKIEDTSTVAQDTDGYYYIKTSSNSTDN
jgi:hypothetical protein